MLPFFGALVYLVARPATPVRDLPPVGEPAPPAYTRLSAADEIEKAGKLRDAGAITEAEFNAIRDQALARAASG